MAISVKERELIAVGISIAACCKPSTDYHVKAVRKTHACGQEIRQVILEAIAVRKGATEIMWSHGLSHLGDEVSTETPDSYKESSGIEDNNKEASRTATLISLGSAYAINCITTLKKYLSVAERMGITTEEITKIVALVAFIKQKAASHVERLCELA